MAAHRSSTSCRFEVLIFVYSLFCLGIGSQVRLLTIEDLSNIGESTSKDFIAVFFDKPEIRKSHPKFKTVFTRSSNILDSFGFELAKVDCSKNVGEPVTECSSKEQKVSIFRKGHSVASEGLDLSYVFDEDSIVANFLHFSLADKFQYVSDDQSFKELLSESQGKQNVILFFVKGLGMKEHRQFLEMVHFSTSSNIVFAMTTDDTFPLKYGLPTNHAALSLLHCKEKTVSESECRSTHYSGRIEKIPLLKFLQSQILPKYVLLSSDKETVYDSLPVAIDKVYVFSDKISELETEELNDMVKELHGSIGVILVDVKEHKDMLASFGLTEDSNFPTAAFLPVKRSSSNSLTYMELFPENSVMFTMNNLKHFIKPFLENPVDEYKRIAEASSLQKISYREYNNIMRSSDEFTNYLLASDFLLAVFCPEDHDDCMDFSKHLRRIVRTFDRAGESRLSVVYVLTSRHNKRFEGQSYPVIHLHLNKSVHTYDEYAGNLGYEELMNFIAMQTNIKMPVFLPPSLSDEARIVLVKDNTDGDVTEYFEDQDETAHEVSDSVEADDGGGDELPAEETEDDEVSATILKAKPTPVPEDLVPALTDKTFDIIKDKSDLLVVDFFQPWDARCKALMQHYVEAATSLGGLDVGDVAIKLARVNCFDWNDVCEKNNITIYPTIKMFRKGSDDIIYNGPLDSDHLTKAVLLLQPAVPLKLKSKEEVDMFFDGTLPKLAKEATDIAVLGMFGDEERKEFSAYKSAALTLQSKFLLGYVTGETATNLSAEYGLRNPTLMIFKRKDPYQTISIFSDPFAVQPIVDFVRRSSISSFGELTPFNLPMYLNYQRPLLIVFRADSQDTSITPVITKIARDNSLPSVFLCWMPVYSSNDVNAEILEAYTGSTDTLPALVMVIHEKGAVYHFKGEVTKETILNWAENILSGAEPATGSLMEKEWTPLLEGYDFLKFIDEEEEEKERKRIKKMKLESAVEEEISKEEESGEEESSEPTEPEEVSRKFEDKLKHGRLRRPEVKKLERDEL